VGKCHFAERRKSFGLFSFYCRLSEVVKNLGLLCDKVTLNYFVMSLWDWLLAAWIYEELFDEDSSNSSHDNTHDYDSSYGYDDYEEDY
jgi:hypothetical protein